MGPTIRRSRGEGVRGLPARSLVPSVSLVLSLALCLALALVLGACSSPATEGQPTAAAAEGAGAQPEPADVAGVVSVRAATADGADADGAAGTIVYENERLGFVAELPAGYTEAQATLVGEEGDTVVLSAADDRRDACLILTHGLEEAAAGGAVGGLAEAGDAHGTDAGPDGAGVAGDAGDAEGADEASDAHVGDPGDPGDARDAADADQAVADPIDEWARTYAAWAIAGLEDEGAAIRRAEIGRATLGGAPCTIVEVEFEPAGGSEPESGGQGRGVAYRDLFFFDGRGEGSQLGLAVDCLAWSKEALDTLENSFVAR